MFTGLVEEVGTVVSVRRSGQSVSLAVRASSFARELAVGDSVCVSGVCLTATAVRGDGTFTADVTPETFSRSSFACLVPGKKVNLERAMAANGRFGGHMVSGHVDGIARVQSVRKDGNSIVFRFLAPPPLLRLIVEKGSVCVDGISLTVASVDSRSFSVALIPHSLSSTTLQFAKEGTVVNIENDVIGKYVEKFMRAEKETAPSPERRQP